MLLLLAGGAFAALVRLRTPRLLWSMAGAALMLGATGYALQGRPLQPGAPARPNARTVGNEEGLIALRTPMFGRYGVEGAYLTAADAVARSGSSAYEVQVLLGAIRGAPKSAQLWTALGDALARHAGGRLSAPARFAFDQAIRLDPRHPGPRFFLGLAQVRAEEFEAAEASWRQALARTAPDASYRSAIAQRLVLLDRLNAS